MKNLRSLIGLIITSILIIYCNSIVFAQTMEPDSSPSAMDVAELRPIIENIFWKVIRYRLLKCMPVMVRCGVPEERK